MDHPNAFAAGVAASISIGAQWLIQRYAHAALSDYWKTAVTGAAMVAVLYVGKNGLKAALVRILNGPKKAWSGSAKPKPAAKPASP